MIFSIGIILSSDCPSFVTLGILALRVGVEAKSCIDSRGALCREFKSEEPRLPHGAIENGDFQCCIGNDLWISMKHSIYCICLAFTLPEIDNLE